MPISVSSLWWMPSFTKTRKPFYLGGDTLNCALAACLISAFVSFIRELILGDPNQCKLITGPVKLDQLKVSVVSATIRLPLGWISRLEAEQTLGKRGAVKFTITFTRHFRFSLEKWGRCWHRGRENLTISVSVNIMAVKPGSYRVRQSSILSNIYVLCLSPQVFDHAELEKLTNSARKWYFSGSLALGPGVSKGQF